MTRQNYMDDSELNEIHYYFNQVTHPESYQNILEIILLRKRSDFNDSDYQNLVRNSIAVATITKFRGLRHLGERVYARIGNKIEMICVNDFEVFELSKLLDGPFDTFQELKLAYNEFLERLEDQNIIDFLSQETNLIDSDLKHETEEIQDESDNFELTSSKGDFGSYWFYKMGKDSIFFHLNEHESEIAKMLNIPESKIYEIINANTIYNIQRYRFNSGEFKTLGERSFAKVGDKWVMIYNFNFGEPELSLDIKGPFDSEENLISKITDFINSVGYDTPEYYGGSYSSYSDSYAQYNEGLSDDFIDNALGGDPEAYWNID